MVNKLEKLNFNHQGEEFCLELCQDAFSRYSARIVRIRTPADESYWCESIIVNTCEGKIEVYDDVDVFGGRTLVTAEDIDNDNWTEMSEEEVLSFMRKFLISNYLSSKK